VSGAGVDAGGEGGSSIWAKKKQRLKVLLRAYLFLGLNTHHATDEKSHLLKIS